MGRGCVQARAWRWGATNLARGPGGVIGGALGFGFWHWGYFFSGFWFWFWFWAFWVLGSGFRVWFCRVVLCLVVLFLVVLFMVVLLSGSAVLWF